MTQSTGTEVIFHILRRGEWNDALRDGIYRPPSLAAEGFIHASRLDQLIATACRFFHGNRDLLIIAIDPRLLRAPLRYESPADPAGSSADEKFPHIYGPLNLDAVTRTIEFPCEADGSFRMPDAIRDISAR